MPEPDTLLDQYDEALISWERLDHEARPRYEALRARLEAERAVVAAAVAWYRSCGENGPPDVDEDTPRGVMIAAIERVIEDGHDH